MAFVPPLDDWSNPRKRSGARTGPTTYVIGSLMHTTHKWFNLAHCRCRRLMSSGHRRLGSLKRCEASSSKASIGAARS